MTKALLISGKAGAGKSLFAQYLNDYLRCDTLLFPLADTLKYLATRLKGWNGEKNTEGRSLLQSFGSEYRGINPNFWTDIVIQSTRVLDPEFLIVPDVRYDSELKRFKTAFDEVILFHIVRPYHISELTPSQLTHSSEQGLADYSSAFEIRNDSDCAHLAEKAKVFAESLKKEKRK